MINRIDLTSANFTDAAINALERIISARKALESAKVEGKERDALQDTLNAAITDARSMDADARNAAVAAERNRLATAYAANPAALLKARAFDETGTTPRPVDGTTVYPSIITAASTDGETLTAAALVSIRAAALVSQEARKELTRHGKRLERLAMRYHYDDTDSEAFKEALTIMCDCYRIFGGNGLKPRRSGKHNDVRNLLIDAFMTNARADSDTMRAGRIIAKVEEFCCASMQARAAKDNAAARFAKEDKQEQERANRAAEKVAKAAEKAKAGKATDKTVKVTAAEKVAKNA